MGSFQKISITQQGSSSGSNFFDSVLISDDKARRGCGGMQLLDDNMGELDIMDTRKYISQVSSSQDDILLENIPDTISGTYVEDYNILYIDDIIRKKIKQEKFKHFKNLKLKYNKLHSSSLTPQTCIVRQKTLASMTKLSEEMEEITTGKKLQVYDDKVKDIINEYKKSTGKVKTIVFDMEEPHSFVEPDANVKRRVHLINEYLDIASEYIQIDVIRVITRPSDVCDGCGASLIRIVSGDEGTIRCPNV